jgi:hypothetical protein
MGLSRLAVVVWQCAGEIVAAHFHSLATIAVSPSYWRSSLNGIVLISITSFKNEKFQEQQRVEPAILTLQEEVPLDLICNADNNVRGRTGSPLVSPNGPDT